jgi:hypothetical protein
MPYLLQRLQLVLLAAFPFLSKVLRDVFLLVGFQYAVLLSRRPTNLCCLAPCLLDTIIQSTLSVHIIQV